MTNSSLRKALSQRLSKNSAEVVKALKSSGVALSKQEESSLMKGNLEGFTDETLSQRFNAKVLGSLGLSSFTHSTFGSSTTYTKSGKKSGRTE